MCGEEKAGFGANALKIFENICNRCKVGYIGVGENFFM
jgi:hypothetical protein